MFFCYPVVQAENRFSVCLDTGPSQFSLRDQLEYFLEPRKCTLWITHVSIDAAWLYGPDESRLTSVMQDFARSEGMRFTKHQDYWKLDEGKDWATLSLKPGTPVSKYLRSFEPNSLAWNRINFFLHHGLLSQSDHVVSMRYRYRPWFSRSHKVSSQFVADWIYQEAGERFDEVMQYPVTENTLLDQRSRHLIAKIIERHLAHRP